jgi:hypothetical protein
MNTPRGQSVSSLQYGSITGIENVLSPPTQMFDLRLHRHLAPAPNADKLV